MIQVLVYGDSLTWGIIPNTRRRLPFEARWPGVMEVMVGHARSKWGTASPQRLPAVHGGMYVLVDDVDAHCRRARAAGATIEAEPADQEWGDRMYTARDREGHQWYFAQRLG